jgi:hypothetical protein
MKLASLIVALSLSSTAAMADYDDYRALQLPVALGDSAEALTRAPVTSPRPYAAGTPSRPRVRLSGADYADAGTTALGLARGAVEGNPLFAWSGSAAPVVGLAGKYGMKRALVAMGHTAEEADRKVGIGSALGTCNNLAVITGATGYGPLLVGAACAGIYAYATRPQPQQPREVLVEVKP